MPANSIPTVKMTVSSGTIPESQKAGTAEWVQRLRQIALYFVLIGATITAATMLADWIHPH